MMIMTFYINCFNHYFAMISLLCNTDQLMGFVVINSKQII